MMAFLVINRRTTAVIANATNIVVTMTTKEPRSSFQCVNSNSISSGGRVAIAVHAVGEFVRSRERDKAFSSMGRC